MLQFPHASFTGTLTAAETTAREALELGYVPLLNNTRAGEETTSWYRGPAVPVLTAPDPFGPYLYSDGAMRLDSGPDDNSSPGSGMFDLSQACAWQIGRLLGLADATFATDLFNWRRAIHSSQNSAELAASIPARLPAAANAASSFGLSLEAADPGDQAPLSVASFLQGLSGHLAEAAIPKVTPHEHRNDAALPGVLPDDVLASLSGAADPLSELLRLVREGAKK